MSLFTGRNPVLNIAHRGGAGERPESTLEAFHHALTVGADVLELDVHLTGDNQLIVSHDEDLLRVSGDPGRVSELSVEEIRGADAGALWTDEKGERPFLGKGLTLPTLEELFDSLPQAQMNVDIKSDAPLAADLTLSLIRRFDRADRTVVASFLPSQLKRIRSAAPEITTSAHPGDVRRFYFLTRLGLAGLSSRRIPYLQIPERHGDLTLLTPRFLKAAHSAGRSVHIWTVNEPADMRRLIRFGVDGIVTDYPSLLARELLGLSKGRSS
ncbi:MAG: glycerophosphodiester phosphodiesterase [Spirochaetaceae bacterium]